MKNAEEMMNGMKNGRAILNLLLLIGSNLL